MTTEDNNTFEQQVNSVVSSMVQDANGTWTIPEDAAKDVKPEVLHAAKLEKRYRDTQGAYTKAQQKLKSLETTNSRLTEHLIENATLHITDEQRAELDDLRSTNPEAWRAKLSTYESEAKELVKQKVQTFQEEGTKMSELELRAQKVEAFKEATGIELTDGFIEEHLPAKYIKDLEAGKIDFDTFLSRSKDYLTKTKVIQGAAPTEEDEEDKNPPNLNKLPGGHKPSPKAVEGDIITSYKNELY